MSTWLIREICEFGKESRQFTLSKDQPLTVGHGDGCVLQLKLRTIDSKHAVVEWNNKKLSYVVRDLGSTNGTFINNAPLTRGTEELRHGDSLRFGHEKTHVYRVEEHFGLSPKPRPPSNTQLAPPTTATQTSPQGNSQTVSEVPPTTPQPVPSSPVVAQLPLMQQGVIFTSGGYFVSGGPQGAIMTPGGPIQYILPQAGGFVPSPTPPISMVPQVQSVMAPSTPPPSSPVTFPDTTHTIQVQDIETESIIDDMPTSPKRTDGRRQVELSNTPSLATTSRLYGQPSWWGEDGRTREHTEHRHMSPKGQILRDFDSDSDTSSVTSNTPRKLSVKDELRLKAISNSASQDQLSTDSWVVDFGPSTRPRSATHTKPRPRSADPSPVRTPHKSRGSTSRPQSMVVKRGRSPVSTKDVANKTVTKKPYSSSSLTRSATTVRKSTPSSPQRVRKSSLDSMTRKKSGSTSDISGKASSSSTRSKNSEPAKFDAKARRNSGSTPDISTKRTDKTYTKTGSKASKVLDKADRKPTAADGKIPPHTMVDKTYTKIGGQGSSDELQTSLSDVSLTSYAEPVVVGEKDGLKSASDSCVAGEGARKTWTKEQSQTPDSLMMANIEARMRQLSKLAQGAARKLSTLKQGLEDMGAVTRDECPHIKPFSSATEQNVPMWNFSQNKEAHSIFRSMKSAEKWLRDIDSALSTMQLLPQVGVATEEGVDYETTTESELEYYHDSIEDNFASCSESYGSD